MRQKQKSRHQISTPAECQLQSLKDKATTTMKFSRVVHNKTRSLLFNVTTCFAFVLVLVLVAMPLVLKYSPFLLDLLYDPQFQHTSLVVLKVPSSGSTWLTSLLNELPSGLYMHYLSYCRNHKSLRPPPSFDSLLLMYNIVYSLCFKGNNTKA